MSELEMLTSQEILVLTHRGHKKAHDTDEGPETTQNPDNQQDQRTGDMPEQSAHTDSNDRHTAPPEKNLNNNETDDDVDDINDEIDEDDDIGDEDAPMLKSPPGPETDSLQQTEIEAKEGSSAFEPKDNLMERKYTSSGDVNKNEVVNDDDDGDDTFNVNAESSLLDEIGKLLDSKKVVYDSDEATSV